MLTRNYREIKQIELAAYRQGRGGAEFRIRVKVQKERQYRKIEILSERGNQGNTCEPNRSNRHAGCDLDHETQSIEANRVPRTRNGDRISIEDQGSGILRGLWIGNP